MDEDDEETACLRASVELMLESDGDIRGTVASLAREIDEFTADGMSNPLLPSITAGANAS
jgi:hypothetical protein